VDGLHSSTLLCSRKIATSNSIGRDSIEALPCLRTQCVTVDNVGLRGCKQVNAVGKAQRQQRLVCPLDLLQTTVRGCQSLF
jgi:hypothetical protein